MTPLESQNWKPGHPGMSYDVLPFLTDMLPRIPSGGTYVEIGSFFGRSLSFAGETRPDLALVAIDPWLEGFLDAGETLPLGADLERCRKYGNLWLAFLETMQEYSPSVLGRVRTIRAPSARGMLVLEDNSADAVFVDGDHAYAAVVEDCIGARRICKPGGWIGFHDCGFRGPVYQAVKSVFPDMKMAPWPEAREGWEPGESSCAWWEKPR